MEDEMKGIIEEVISEINKHSGHVKMKDLDYRIKYLDNWGKIVSVLISQGFLTSDGQYLTLTEREVNSHHLKRKMKNY